MVVATLVAVLSVHLGLLHIFSLIMFWYANVVVVPTALSVAALRLAWKGNPVRLTPAARVLVILFLFALPLCAYASFIEPYQLRLERAEVALEDSTSLNAPIRIAVLADIQTDSIGAHEERAVEMALAAKPDIIVLPGDFFQGNERQFQEALPRYRALLNRLSAPGGIYACPGNLDRPDRLAALFENTPVRLLNNEIVTAVVGEARIAIAGVENLFFHEAGMQTIHQLAQTDADARILLAHLPDAALRTTPDDQLDLIISGHTHGGQVVVPGFGPLMKATSVPRAVAAGGLHHIKHQWIYVSRGVGFEHAGAPPLRFLCPPEVSLITLTPGEQNRASP